MKALRFVLAAAMLSSTVAAHALEYRSVGAAPAILYDAPTSKGRKVFVAPRGMPVEIVLTYGEWTKVRDASGDLAWVASRALAPRRTLVVSVSSARIRSAAEDNAALAFTAERGVLLDLVEPVSSGWVRVRHADGAGGFVRAAEVWGE
ncbi:MAG TPA: SH3 domain-containing protein [Noviherbaspirillum sp.]